MARSVISVSQCFKTDAVYGNEISMKPFTPHGNKMKDSFNFFLFSSHPNNMYNGKHEWQQQLQMLLKSTPNMAPG